jgi:hypothetical protein
MKVRDGSPLPFSITQDRPLNDEWYGLCWTIGRPGNEQAIIVADPGDGSARAIAERILSMLNSESQSLARENDPR